MSEQVVATYLGYLWDAFAVVWLVSALAVKRTTRAEPHWVAIGRSVLLGLALYGLYAAPPQWHWLRLRLVPDSPSAHAAGLAIAALAMAFAAWARFALGTNWSSRATIKEGHELIVRGPYRIVRNPIYTGIFFAMVGTAVALGQVRHFLGLPLVLLVWWWKIANEQKILREQFGDQYLRYCREVKAFIPYVI